MRREIFLLASMIGFLLQPLLCELKSESAQVKRDQEEIKHEVVVVLKLVQVYVTDKEGNPVTDLTKSDFILYDNGRLQKITDFEKHILLKPEEKIEEELEETRLPSPRKVTPKISRKFFLLLDYYQNDVEGLKKSKEAALHFIDTQLQPSDEVGVLSFSPFRGLILHEYLTTDHEEVRQKIKDMKEIPARKGGYQGAALSVMVMRREEKEIESGVRPSPLPRRSKGVNPIEPEDFAIQIREFGKVLRYIPGYKNIILFSSGFARSLLYDPRDPRFREMYKEMSKELAASSSPVYAVNAEGSRAHFRSSWGRGDHALQMLSNLSGGKYFEDVKHYKTIAKEIQNITSNYYVLGYYIDEKWDGKYHEIKVEVQREGYKVHAQGGFFNPKPFSDFSEFEKQLHLLDLALSEKPYFQEPLRFSLVALPCADRNESNLVLLSEIPVEKIEDVIRQKTEVVTLIFDRENSVVESTQGEINFSTVPRKTIYHYMICSLFPGEYECRLVVRNLKTGKCAVASTSVVIPEPLDTGMRLYPPLLLIPGKESSYLKASKAEKGETGGEPLSLISIYPFLSNEYSPVVEELERGISRLLAVVHCSIFGIQEPDVELSAHLVRQLSLEKTPLSFSILSAEKEEKTDVLLIEFELPKLQPGGYILEISAEETTTNVNSKVIRTFKVR